MGDRLADDVAPADHDSLGALERDAMVGKQRHDSERRRRHERWTSEVELAGVERMETVDVLERVDCPDHSRLVELRREWKLDEDSIDGVGGVQRGDELEQLFFRDVLRELSILGDDARLLRGLVLAAEVDRRGRIVPHLQRHEPEGAELAHLAGHLGANPGRERRSFHQGRHGAGGYRANS